MLCCLGFFAGMAAGSAMGGPWTFIAPAAGFGLGLVGDMRLMRGRRKNNGGQENYRTSCCGNRDMDGEGTASLPKDLVCGMPLEDNVAKHTATFNGTTYHFCSFKCASSFKDNPEKYIS